MSGEACKTIEEYVATWRKKRWVPAYELAEAMEVSPRTVRNWLYSGKTPLKPWQAHGDVRYIRFTASSVISFVLEGFQNT